MQTEAAPREPFTLNVLFRYKFTIFAVAVFVILAGYVRIITQPRLFEATARLSVRFTSEAPALAGVSRDNFYRLPLLEEEVKSYQSQLTDERFINEVLDALPVDEEPATPRLVSAAETAAQRFSTAFLSAYYSIRKTFFAALDAILLNKDYMITEREQRVLLIRSRLTVSAGTEASHIITVSYLNSNKELAANFVNTLAKKFIEHQKTKVKSKDEAAAQKVIDDAVAGLFGANKRLFEIANELGSPTIQDAIELRYQKLERLRDLKRSFETGKQLLLQGIIPYDRQLPLEAPALTGELEREFFNLRMLFDQLSREKPDAAKVYQRLSEEAHAHMEERRKVAVKRDLIVVDAQIAVIEQQITEILSDEKIMQLTPEFARLSLDQTLIQTKIAQGQAEITEVKAFNKELLDENISENIALKQPAQVPPFYLPQHREVKLLVIIALGIFAGCAAALLRHYVRPKPIRRRLPMDEEEADIPIVLLPDDGKGGMERDLELDISFPSDSAGEGSRGKEMRR